MKKISRYLGLLLISRLSACAVHTPHGSVVIDPEGYRDGHGNFCPSGQAKKGPC